MSSFEERYYLANPTYAQRLRRNVRLALDSARFLVLWATRGRRLRALVRQAERDGSQVVLEDFFGSRGK